MHAFSSCKYTLYINSLASPPKKTDCIDALCKVIISFGDRECGNLLIDLIDCGNLFAPK